MGYRNRRILLAVSLSGLLILGFQNCGQIPSFSGYRPSMTGATACTSNCDFTSEGENNSPPPALVYYPKSVINQMAANTDCYSLLFDQEFEAAQLPNSSNILQGTSNYGAIKLAGDGNVSLSYNEIYGDVVFDRVKSAAIIDIGQLHGALCVKTDNVSAVSINVQDGADSVLGFVADQNSSIGSVGSITGGDLYVPLVFINQNVAGLTAVAFHKDILVYNGSINIIQGQMQDIHLFGTAHVNLVTGASAGHIYLHDSASVGSVTVSSGGQTVNCSLAGSNCPEIQAPEMPAPLGF